MAGKPKPAEEESGGESVGLWYVSFSDMITLLLSFFVMLATFSSYSKEGMNKFAGTCAYIAAYSILGGRPDHSMVPTERAYEQAKEGSEKPTGESPGQPKTPRASTWTQEASAYRDRRVFRIRSSEVFFGNGAALTPLGTGRLDLVADFMKRLPCRLIVSEIALGGDDGARSRLGLERGWSIVNYLVTVKSVPAGSVSLSPSGTSPPKEGEPDAVELVLLSQEAAP
jgi:flagellar motor protein MotB